MPVHCHTGKLERIKDPIGKSQADNATSYNISKKPESYIQSHIL